MYFILNFLLTTYSSISYNEITTTLSSRNLSLSSTFIALIVILYFVFISYSNYSVSIFYSNIVFTDSQHNISIFIVLFLLFIYMYNLNHWITNFKNFNEYLSILILSAIWFIGLFMITNFITFIFFFELLSLSMLLVLALFINNNKWCFFKVTGHEKFLNFNLFIYSFIYLFWISFLAIINLFVLLIYIFKSLVTLDFSLFEVIILHNLSLISFSNFSNLLIIWCVYLFSFFLKLGLVPFFLWKPNFFKSIPLAYIYIYVGYFFYFLFLFFLNLLYSSFYLWVTYLIYINLILAFFGFIILVFSLLNITNIKIFIAFSSILNSFLLFITILVLI